MSVSQGIGTSVPEKLEKGGGTHDVSCQGETVQWGGRKI